MNKVILVAAATMALVGCNGDMSHLFYDDIGEAAAARQREVTQLKATMDADETACRAGNQQACLLYQAEVQRWVSYVNSMNAADAARRANAAAMIQTGAALMRPPMPAPSPLGSFSNPATCHTMPLGVGYTQVQCY